MFTSWEEKLEYEDRPSKEEELNTITYQLATEPVANVFTKEQFEERAYKVFDIIYQKLSNSFGPGGAGTFVSIYPSYYNTKDGYAIMKNIEFERKLDQVICEILMSVCSRLNFTVGDGTTTATIAAKTIYDEYMQNRDVFLNNGILPRQIINEFMEIKEEIIDELKKKSIMITNKGPEYLYEAIRDVVSISSNGDPVITSLISDLYKELQYPGISCVISKDGITKSQIINGYKIDISLTDKSYTNNDDKTMVAGPCDVIIFDHKVTRETYINILKPLDQQCSDRQRRLICVAPYYDETLLSNEVSMDFKKEVKLKGYVNMVLTVGSVIRAESKVALNDFAMLCNTTVITSGIEKTLIEKLTNGGLQIFQLFDLDNRDIEGSIIAVYGNKENNTLRLEKYSKESTSIPFMSEDGIKDSYCIRVGYVDNAEVGLEESVFSGFHYDEETYKLHMNEAVEQLEDIRKKCETKGVFSEQLNIAQRRVFALTFKTGIIEVGATSEMNRDYLKDLVIDSIKAAASAYNHGVIKGCNVTLLSILKEKIDDAREKVKEKPNSVKNKIRYDTLSMFFNGFINVYKTVLVNVYGDTKLTDSQFKDNVREILSSISKAEEHITCHEDADPKHLCQIIADSIKDEKVYDVSKGIYSESIINSEKTDEEVLTAIVDLLAMLITGNQLVFR